MHATIGTSILLLLCSHMSLVAASYPTVVHFIPGIFSRTCNGSISPSVCIYLLLNAALRYLCCIDKVTAKCCKVCTVVNEPFPQWRYFVITAQQYRLTLPLFTVVDIAFCLTINPTALLLLTKWCREINVLSFVILPHREISLNVPFRLGRSLPNPIVLSTPHQFRMHRFQYCWKLNPPCAMPEFCWMTHFF